MASPRPKRTFLYTPTRDEKSAFIKAAAVGHTHAVKEFLENFSSSADVKDEFYMTALMWAARNGYEETVTLLVEKGADLNERDFEGWTPLMFAVTSGQRETVELLLEKGADTGRKENFGKTAAALAGIYNHHALADLIEQWPEIKSQREIEKEARELAKEIADFSPGLKKDMPTPRRFKNPRRPGFWKN